MVSSLMNKSFKGPRRNGAAVVGVGIAAPTCARRFIRSRYGVAILGKGRRTGGRVSTRRKEGLVFDHGVEYFTAKSEVIRQTTTAAARPGNAWRLVGVDGSIVYEADLVVVAIPALRGVRLLARSAAQANRVAALTMVPCWAAMWGFGVPVALQDGGALVGDGPMAWISRDRSKPGRDGGEAVQTNERV